MLGGVFSIGRGGIVKHTVFEQIKYWEKDGTSLVYGEAGPADAPTLVLLHAIRNTSMLFAGIVPELSKQYRVLAVDLRGHGGSAKEGPYTFEQIVEDLAEWLVAEQIRPIALVAASFSAVPAQMLAVRLPDQIRSVILLDGGYYRLGEVPGFELISTVERLANVRFDSVAEAESRFAMRYGKGDLPDGWMTQELVEREAGRYGYALPKEAFDGYFQSYSSFESTELFRNLHCPLLLLLADEQHIPDEEQRAFYRKAARSFQETVKQSKVSMIPGSQHLLMVTHPRETIDAILHFFHDLA